MTYLEWVARYEQKSGDKHLSPKDFYPVYSSDKGYAQYGLTEDIVWVYEVCGDGKYWYQYAIDLCRAKNIRWVATICTRKLKPYLRLMQGEILKEEVTEFHNAVKIQGRNHLGGKVIVVPAWWDEEKQRNAYYVYSEVLNNEIRLTDV